MRWEWWCCFVTLENRFGNRFLGFFFGIKNVFKIKILYWYLASGCVLLGLARATTYSFCQKKKNPILSLNLGAIQTEDWICFGTERISITSSSLRCSLPTSPRLPISVLLASSTMPRLNLFIALSTKAILLFSNQNTDLSWFSSHFQTAK